MFVFSSHDKSKSLVEKLVFFKEIIANLKTLKVKYDEEDLMLILLCSLPVSYLSFIDMILYSHETLTVEVYDTFFFCSNEKMKHLVGFKI